MQLSDLTESERYSLVGNQLAKAHHAFIESRGAPAPLDDGNPSLREPNYLTLADDLRRILRLIEESE